MIWCVLAIMALLAAVYITAPLLRVPPTSPGLQSQSVERDAYLAEIKQLETGEDDNEEQAARKLELERRLLALMSADHVSSQTLAPAKLAFVTIIGALAFGGAGLYLMIGRPDYMSASLQQPDARAPVTDARAQMQDLTTQLKARLDEQPYQPQGWLIYARSLMQIGRFDEAFPAYETAIAQNDNNAALTQELASARAFAAQQGAASQRAIQPGPSQADVEAASQMSEQDRALMIEGMVASLAAKLEENPKDAAGWTQLLSARKVLGQEPQARIDIERLSTIFADQPETRDIIIMQSGWAQ